jgi:hypothetical protein
MVFCFMKCPIQVWHYTWDLGFALNSHHVRVMPLVFDINQWDDYRATHSPDL